MVETGWPLTVEVPGHAKPTHGAERAAVLEVGRVQGTGRGRDEEAAVLADKAQGTRGTTAAFLGSILKMLLQNQWKRWTPRPAETVIAHMDASLTGWCFVAEGEMSPRP
eukprot:TRINITY_DN569_c0_g1_i8.p7 TRINITY_DN569_c0_g1~~TRINITY_DN569_c0_g1_i8.p7  ORF type:complete len:109 (+),score=2.21 TRINITY_DN569_c0_g1_i8:2583-2909(+)